MVKIMKKLCILLAVSSSLSMISSAKHASASWLCKGTSLKEHETLRSVIVMKIDAGWHTYWKNPGVTGIAPKLKATLPEGWSLGEIQYPVPIYFTTAGLPGFGYENEVRLPVTIIPPKSFTGEIPTITGTLNWLTCNDSSCVPGKAELTLLEASSPKLIDASYHALPTTLHNAHLSFTIIAEKVQFTLQLTGNDSIDLGPCEVLCATPEVIDATAKPTLQPVSDQPKTWTAEAVKNEYLFKDPERVTLLLKHPDGRAWEVTSAP